MSDIRQWLEDLGLGQYAEAFEAEQVTVANLVDLTDSELKYLGLPLGPRKTVLKEAENLDPAAEQTDSDEPKIVDPPREAGRRQITVMFCDLVGSTALAEALDPEDLRTLMQSYQQTAGRVIERYSGHVAQYLGDGLMTYFGWPQAHEDDAERAVRAGLEVVLAVKSIEAPSALQIRIGIATGPVVVGETGAGDASVPKLAVGETPNLAARLQGLADADEIVIGPSTRRLLGGTFELDDLGEQSLKGIVEPVQAFRATGLAAIEGRFEAQHQHLTPLVGRDAEMAMVVANWDRAKAGKGQVIALSGEPGIGKSRITQTMRERVADESHTILRYQCSPYHTNSVLHPVIEQLERGAGFQRDDSKDQKLDKLEALFPEASNGTGRALIASLLSLPVERYPALSMSPQKQKEETLRELLDQVVALTAKAPILLIFEDAHWIDPTSQELLDRVVQMVASRSVFAVITFRPEYEPPWLSQDHVTALALNRLDSADAAAMVAQVSDTMLSEDLLEKIVARTDGVPLFVEELTKTMAEGGMVTVPETLQDSLMARLDRLGAVKDIAQIGACIGRQFSHDLLEAVSSIGGAELDEALQQLVDSELVHRSADRFTFKHALIQDTAYDSLLRSRRQHLHERIGKTLERSFPDVVAAEPEALFRHFSAAGLISAAMPYAIRAGQAAMASGAPESAIGHLTAGVSVIGALPASASRDAIELDLRLDLGTGYIFARGWAFENVKPNYDRCRELVARSPDPHKSFNATLGIFYYYNVTSQRDAADEVAEELLEMAERNNDDQQLLLTYQARGQTHWQRGRYAEAVPLFEKSVDYYDDVRDPPLAQIWGGDFLCMNLGFAAICMGVLGHLDRAFERAMEADAQAHKLGSPIVLCNSKTFLCFFLWMRGAQEQSMEVANDVLAMATENGLGIYAIWMNFLIAAGELRMGRPARAIEIFEQALAASDMVGAKVFRGYQVALTAPAYAQVGRAAEGLALIDRTLAACAVSGDGNLAVELQLARAEIKYHSNTGDRGEADLLAAIAIARDQSARFFELRAATALADMWHDQGKVRQAHDMLAPVYGWFTEGFDTADLKKAKALLETLK